MPTKSTKIPYGAIRWLVGNMHVSKSDESIAAEIRKRANPETDPGWTPRRIEKAIEYAIKVHADNRHLYNCVMSGRVDCYGKKRKRP